MESQFTDKFRINFYDFDHGFCESKFYGSHPEYLNVISSLMMSILTIGKDNDIMFSIRLNGIASAIYHFNGFILFGVIDRASMILIALSTYNFLSINRKFTILHILSLIVSLSLHIESVFNILFGIFLFVIYYNIRKFSSGGKFLIFSAVVWMISELYICNIFTFYFHFFWHIICVCSVIIVIKDYNKIIINEKKVSFNSSDVFIV